MRRAGHERTASRDTTSSTPLTGSPRGSVVRPRHFANGAASTVAQPEEVSRSPGGTSANGSAAGSRAERRRQMGVTILQRIESRLPGRVRNLNVRIVGSKVVLEGQCATYYTKQLAQHAALGVLEDEQLENAIVVSVSR